MIEIDEATDQMLERIAATGSEEPDARLIQELIPDREAFVRFTVERNLLHDEAADSILAILGYSKQQPIAGRNKKRLSSHVSDAIKVQIVNKVVGKGFARGDVFLWVDRLLKAGGRSAAAAGANPKLRRAILLELDALRGVTKNKSGEKTAKAKKKGRIG